MTTAMNLKSRETFPSDPLSLPPYLQELVHQGAHIYEVGGPVRDRLLQRETKDHDILVRNLSLDKIRRTLQRFGEVFLVGKSFGVLKFRPKDGPDIEYDVVLPRIEKSTGPGHKEFEVLYDPSLPVEQDLSRRDFTINAMAYDYAANELIDPFGGRQDLEKRTLRQVKPESFQEDPLRLLRAVQFAARLHLKIEKKTRAAMETYAPLIETVSAERITMEMAKLLTAPKPSLGLCLMRDTNLLKYVFPELHKTVGVEQGRKLKNDDVFMHTMRVLDASRQDKAIPYAGNMELMLAALFHDIGKPQTKRFDKKKQRITFYGHQTVSRKLAEKRMRQLKMTTMGIKPKNVAVLVENHMFQAKSFFSEKAIRRFIRQIGEDLILKLVDLRIADNRGGKYPEGIRGVQKLRRRIAEELERQPALTTADLAIDGHDLMTLGVPEGPEIGHILRNLVEVVLDEPSQNEKETLLRIVRDTLGYGNRGENNERSSEKGPATRAQG